MTDHPRYRVTERSLDVGFTFGALSASALTGPVLVRLLAELQITESAARNLLVKMVRMRALSAERVGRTTVYRLAAQPARKYQQVEGTAGPPRWEGAFSCIVYDIPERERSFRDRLRHLAAFNGYAALRPGVLIAPREHVEDFHEVLLNGPPGTRIHVARLEPEDLGQARVIAAEAWDLPGLATRYTALIRAIAAEHAAGPGEDVEADPWPVFRRLARLYRQVLTLQIDDPDLPPELLTDDWPRENYWAMLSALNAHWGPRMQPAVRAVAAGLDPHGLIELYPAPWESQDYVRPR